MSSVGNLQQSAEKLQLPVSGLVNSGVIRVAKTQKVTAIFTPLISKQPIRDSRFVSKTEHKFVPYFSSVWTCILKQDGQGHSSWSLNWHQSKLHVCDFVVVDHLQPWYLSRTVFVIQRRLKSQKLFQLATYSHLTPLLIINFSIFLLCFKHL